MLLADRVLFIDAEALVVDKPAGLPVDTPRDKAVSVESHLDLLRFGFQRPPTPVHRLDRDTSGCLLLARTERAARRYAQAFEAGRVDKLYWAVLDGTLDADAGEVALSLAKVSTKAGGWRMVPARKGKPALTRWARLAEHDGRSLVALRPATGRTHQLRVHAASGLGAAIAGDSVYGRGGGPMLLHARALTLPREGKPPVAAVAPPPPHWPDWARG